MWSLALLATLCAISPELDVRVNAGQGSVGLLGGYRYVPNPFFEESLQANDPVVSTYYGAPSARLHFDYFPLATVPVMVDVGWTMERHELASGGWIELQLIDLSLSAGFKPDVDWAVQPYGVVGIDQIAGIVRDKIRSVGTPASGMTGGVGVHVAAGAMAPTLFSLAPWLNAVAELSYTWAPMTQRGRTFWVMGFAAMAGLAFRYDADSLMGLSRMP